MMPRGILFSLILSLLFAPFARAAGPAVTVKTVDETTVVGTLAGLENGKLVLSSSANKIALEDIVEMTTKGGAAAVNTAVRKLVGKVIGTEGSYKDEGRTRDKVFDGDLESFFDAPEEHASDAWVGLDLGAPRIITEIKYAARQQGTEPVRRRIIGGKFQGSNSADFSSGVIDFFVVSKMPDAGKLASQSVSVSQPFRYVRYLTPPNGLCNIAEVEFWGKDPSAKGGAGSTASAKKMPATTMASTQPAKAWKIVMIGDDQFAAVVSAWSEQKLTVQTHLTENHSLDIPFDQVRELWCGTEDQIKQARALKLEAGVEDTAFVIKDGAVVSVRGVAVGIDADSLLFKFNDEQKKINLAKLVGLILGGQENKRDDHFRQTVQFNGSDTVSGSWRTYDPATNLMGLETRWGAKLAIPFDQISRIRSANGRLVYVGDLKPVAVEQVPYFDRMLPYRVDKSLTGGPLKLSDGEYARGIAVHSRTVLTYDAGGQYAEFKSKVGFQQPEGKIGQAVIRVIGDGKVLYEDLDARGDGKPADLSLKIAGVTRLTLEVDFGKNEDTGDRVVWANARLLRARK
jgi:hypothetical protein